SWKEMLLRHRPACQSPAGRSPVGHSRSSPLGATSCGVRFGLKQARRRVAKVAISRFVSHESISGARKQDAADQAASRARSGKRRHESAHVFERKELAPHEWLDRRQYLL